MTIGKGGQQSRVLLTGVPCLHRSHKSRRRGDPYTIYRHLRHTCTSVFQFQGRMLSGSVGMAMAPYWPTPDAPSFFAGTFKRFSSLKGYPYRHWGGGQARSFVKQGYGLECSLRLQVKLGANLPRVWERHYRRDDCMPYGNPVPECASAGFSIKLNGQRTVRM
ncbi:hypothetical protein BJV74DRAFT_849297 [Russula compacta]|nr:hypothetical protein BJV74DRAFT_849297 [Russula compacta]